MNFLKRVTIIVLNHHGRSRLEPRDQPRTTAILCIVGYPPIGDMRCICAISQASRIFTSGANILQVTEARIYPTDEDLVRALCDCVPSTTGL